MYDNSSVVGNVGETMALSEFARRGVTVLIPFGQNVPYDLVIEIKGKFYRIQCKTTQKVHNQERMRFNICRTNGFTGKHSCYTENEIDFFFLYCIENNYMGLVSISEVKGKRDLFIRLTPPKNNQKGVNMASNYEIDKQLGSLAQSG